MKRLLTNILLICGLWLASAAPAAIIVAAIAAIPAAAQDMLRAAVVVNDEIISALDLDMRLKLAIFATGQPDSAQLRNRLTPQVIRALIDERLQAQEAERLGITVSDAEVEKAAREIAQRNNVTYEQFAKVLEDRGIIPSAFLDQVRGQLTWNALITRRLRPSVEVSEEEVDDIVRRITASRGLKQRRVSEIFLAVDTALQEDEVRANAERLIEQLRAGADFPALARQFSESASAARGGDLGWVQEGQLPEELDAMLARMRPGTMSRPVRTLSGYHILLLRQERETTLGTVTLQLKQLLFPLSEGATEDQKRSLVEQAEAARTRVSGCADLDALATEVGAAESTDLGTVNLSDLPPPIRDAVSDLPIGRPSQPISVSGGLSILVVCERTESGIDRTKIRDRLGAQQLDMLARRYMRDLRRNANVDIRL